MVLIWRHISPEPMRCPECKNIGPTLWPIRKTSFWFGWHVEHLFLCFPDFFPIQADIIPPVWPVSCPCTRGQRRLRWPEPGVSSSFSGAWWHQSSQSGLSGGHGVNILPVNFCQHLKICQTRSFSRSSELFSDFQSGDTWTMKRQQSWAWGAANVLLNSYVMKFD